MDRQINPYVHVSLRFAIYTNTGNYTSVRFHKCIDSINKYSFSKKTRGPTIEGNRNSGKKVNICVPSNIHETDVNKVVNFVTNHLCIQRKVTLSGWDKKNPTRSYKSQTSPVSATRQ